MVRHYDMTSSLFCWSLCNVFLQRCLQGPGFCPSIAVCILRREHSGHTATLFLPGNDVHFVSHYARCYMSLASLQYDLLLFLLVPLRCESSGELAIVWGIFLDHYSDFVLLRAQGAVCIVPTYSMTLCPFCWSLQGACCAESQQVSLSEPCFCPEDPSLSLALSDQPLVYTSCACVYNGVRILKIPA